MCDFTHSNASLARTNTHARDLSALLDENNPANANSNSNFDAKLNSPQTISSLQNDPVTTARLRTYAEPEVVAGLSPNMDTSANTIQFLHLNVEESGLFIHGSTLVGTSFQPGEEVSIALFNGTAVITTDQHKRALIKSRRNCNYAKMN